jgi:hypothetical protein
VGKNLEQLHIGPVENQLLGKQAQDRKYGDGFIGETDRNKCASLSHGVGAIAIREVNMALAAHDSPQAGIAQSSQQVTVFGINAERPEDL